MPDFTDWPQQLHINEPPPAALGQSRSQQSHMGTSPLERCKALLDEKARNSVRVKNSWDRKLQKAVAELQKTQDEAQAQMIAHRIATIRVAKNNCEKMITDFNALKIQLELMEHAQDHTSIIDEVTNALTTMRFDPGLLIEDYKDETQRLDSIHEQLVDIVGAKDKQLRMEEAAKIMDEYGVQGAAGRLPMAPLTNTEDDILQQRFNALSSS